jgi:hypothetical protein
MAFSKQMMDEEVKLKLVQISFAVFFIRKQTKILLFVEKCFQFQGRDQ